MAIPFSVYEERARAHGILASVAFLIIVPLGVLIPRYLRTFSNRWWWAHWLINLLVAAPLIFAAWAMAKSARSISHLPTNHHSVGRTIFGLYIVQFLFGAVIHFVRVPIILHVGLGLLILTHGGLYHQWEYATGNVHPVKGSLKHAWLALLLIFWLMYSIGLVLLRRQFAQEREGRLLKQDQDGL
ncbi:hypothetical protein F5148DRAFT_1182489 [Russula earlei]|uniref:Uncharacterized protein n=1 Tax=Russula earlei TaxID=71964 RepID=A0ACC0UFK8_9AGAM|nr:hypothetical protein F5148DRAFT_1182489 [Russula earlei]